MLVVELCFETCVELACIISALHIAFVKSNL